MLKPPQRQAVNVACYFSDHPTMTTDKEKEYYFSIVTIAIGCILTIPLIGLFSCVSFAFVYIFSHFDRFKYSYLILLVCSVFFILLGLLMLDAIQRLYKFMQFYLQKKPALTLTKDKLIDNINDQIYNWADIKKISTKTSAQANAVVSFISISLYDPDKFIDKIKNSYKRRLARINEKYLIGAFSIQPNIINCKNSELLEDLINYWNNRT